MLCQSLLAEACDGLSDFASCMLNHLRLEVPIIGNFTTNALRFATSSFAKRGTIDGINRYKHKKRGNQQKQKVKVTNKRAAERQLRILNLHLKQWGEETEWGCCCHVKLASWGFLYRFPRTALSIHSATYSTLEEFNPAIEIRPLPVM